MLKIFAAIGAALVVGFSTVVGLFVMVVALNGFSDRDGGVGINVYVALAFLTTLGAAIAGATLSMRLERRGHHSPVLTGWLHASIGGAAGLIVSFVIGIIVAMALRGR